MVEQSGEPLLLPSSCCLPHTVQSLGHAFPALSRVHARLNDVLLSLRPSLPNLRGGLPSFVRLVHRCRVGGGACTLASVRRSNCTYGFPVCSFHEDTARRRELWVKASGPTSRP